MSSTELLLKTPLHDLHVAAGGRMVPFAGWDMPVQYSGVIAEHTAVRTSAGIFDVSHMGQFILSGSSAFHDLQRMLSNDLGLLADDGTAQYTLLMNDEGGIEDDLIVYRQAADRFLLVVNAANVAHDRGLLTRGKSAHTVLDDVSADYAMIALQGPLALDVLADVFVDVREHRPFTFSTTDFDGAPIIVAMTGYTGERGCELMLAPDAARTLWQRLAADGRVTTCGLGARDTLRLEACYPLHGNDIGPATSAVEAGLSWACGWDTEFVGREALDEERIRGSHRRLVALATIERGIPRAGCEVIYEGEVAGHVTSGTMSPSIGVGIGLAYVTSAAAEIGTGIEIDVRGKLRAARVARKPLYKKEKPA